MNSRSRSHAAMVRPRMLERIEFRLVAGIAIMLCLVLVAARRAAGATSEQSMVSEAYSAAMAAIGYAYTA